MHLRESIFQSRQSRQSFWILFMGCLLIIGASLSIFSTDVLRGRNRISSEHLAMNVVKAVTVARSVPIARLPGVIRLFRGEGFAVSMNPGPLLDGQILQLTDPASLRQYVLRHARTLRISIPLANGQWLNIRVFHSRNVWLKVGLILSSLVLLFALVSLCIWAIKRLDVPMRSFLKATKRFGVDIQSPPLAVVGSPEMQEVIRAFNEMQNRIRRLLEDRTQMLAAISHDLRTPITRLQLRAEYLKDSDQYEKAVADLKEMENMIASILSFARDHVRSESMERFDLNALLESVCNDLVDVGHDVVYHSELQRTPFFGRITGLKRAFVNLIENAVKYGNKAEVTLKKSGHHIHVRIVDEGPGIPEAQFEKVFAPFYRVDPSRSPNKSGAGLGLAVARDIIRAHGGEITLLNRESKGLVVLVILPMSDA